MLRRAFTLIEMVIVLAISGLMLGFALQANQSGESNLQSCYTSTRIQMITIRGAIETFARANDRLPLPAARNVGVESISYGRESSGAAIDSASGVSFGALPFQTLGLPSSYAGDCWGNKFTYAVTTALTTNAASGGFLDNSVVGNITITTDGSVNFVTDAAYAIISHGEDELGAVKLNYSGASHGWCSGTAISRVNCAASSATLANAAFNDGKGAGFNYYFDDLLVSGGKPKLTAAVSSTSTYCWGGNTYGRIGDGTTTDRLLPTLVAGSTGTPTVFQKVLGNMLNSCGLTSTGAAYCWGRNNEAQLGDGTLIDRSLPTLVSGSGVAPLVFTQISVHRHHGCGLTATGAAYCWGYNGSGQIGDGTVTTRTTPRLVLGSGSAPLVFTQITVGSYHTCGLVGSGAVYCWGHNNLYQLGDGTAGDRGAPTLVLGSGSAPMVFTQIASGYFHNCGITATGAAYCWGQSNYGQVGDGSAVNRSTPVLVSGSGSAPKVFTKIEAWSSNSCAITGAGAAYCWGYNADGSVGDSTASVRYSPTLVAGSGSGSLVFTRLTSGGTACAMNATGAVYCWGPNGGGYIGDGTSTYRYIPTLVKGSGSSPLVFSDIGGNCAIIN